MLKGSDVSLSGTTPSPFGGGRKKATSIPRVSSHRYVAPPTVRPGVCTRWPIKLVCSHTSPTRASSRFLTPCVALCANQPAKASTDGSTVARQQWTNPETSFWEKKMTNHIKNTLIINIRLDKHTLPRTEQDAMNEKCRKS